MNRNDKTLLRKFAGNGDGPAFSIDEMQGLMLQISFAIMMVFMIAYFMFREKSQKEQEEKVLELERQKLVAAAEKVESAFEERYGLNILMRRGEDGGKKYDPAVLVENGDIATTPVLRSAFASGSGNARADYSDMLALRAKWMKMILEESGLNAAALARENLEWLNSRADAGVSGEEADVRTVQRMSAAALQKHWLTHPEDISDPAVAELLGKFNAADEAGRLLLATELSYALKRHSLDVLSESAGAEMLP